MAAWIVLWLGLSWVVVLVACYPRLALMVILVSWVLISFTGCDNRPEYREADGLILCDVTTHHAFNVRPGAGETSFITPLPQADPLCVP